MNILNNVNEYLEKKLKTETFVDMMFWIIDEKKLTDVYVYKKANLDRKFFSKLRCDSQYKPKKKNVVAIALALQLDNATAKQFIKKAGYILTSSKKFDLAIRYCFENQIYDLFDVNILLDNQGLETL